MYVCIRVMKCVLNQYMSQSTSGRNLDGFVIIFGRGCHSCAPIEARELGRRLGGGGALGHGFWSSSAAVTSRNPSRELR